MFAKLLDDCRYAVRTWRCFNNNFVRLEEEKTSGCWRTCDKECPEFMELCPDFFYHSKLEEVDKSNVTAFTFAAFDCGKHVPVPVVIGYGDNIIENAVVDIAKFVRMKGYVKSMRVLANYLEWVDKMNVKIDNIDISEALVFDEENLLRYHMGDDKVDEMYDKRKEVE